MSWKPTASRWFMDVHMYCMRTLYASPNGPNTERYERARNEVRWNIRSTSVGNISFCNGMRDVEKVQFCVAASVTGHREMVLCKIFRVCFCAYRERSIYCATDAAREKNNRKQSVCMLMCLFVVVGCCVALCSVFGLGRWSCERNYAHI